MFYLILYLAAGLIVSIIDGLLYPQESHGLFWDIVETYFISLIWPSIVLFWIFDWVKNNLDKID